MNILVRNLSREINKKELFMLFQSFGKIKSHDIVIDAATGKSKGFGFIDMPEDSEAAAAIKALDGKLIKGLKIRVKKTARQNYHAPQDNPIRVRPEHSEARKENSAPKRKSSALSTGRKKLTRKDRH